MGKISTDANCGAVSDTLFEALVRRIESDELELPLLPEVPARLLSMTAGDDCDARSLAELIHRDQALAGNILRLANSALYLPTTPIVSLQQAVTRLGMKKIREMALLISCGSRVFQVPGCEDIVRTLFEHAIAAAAFAQEIARSRRWNVEEAFLCGLLHDVGRPIIMQTLSDLSQELDVPVDQDGLLAASDALHCEVGARVVTHWSLPDRLGETIRFHHEPEAAPSCAQSAMLTRLAADLAHHLVGPREMTEDEIRSHPMLVPLNLYSDELNSILDGRETISQTVRAFGG